MASASGNITLYIHSYYAHASGNLPLYIEGATSGTLGGLDSSVPLYIYGSAKQANIPLYIYGRSTSDQNRASISLYTYGRGEPVSNNLDLFIEGSDALSLFTLSLEQLFDLSDTELYELLLSTIEGHNNGGGLNLFIRGEGLYENFIPASGAINLYISGPSGVNDTRNMYIRGYDTYQSTMNMYTYGVSGVISQNMDLYINGKVIEINNLKLFIRGYNPETS